MNNKQKIEFRLSKVKSRLNEISGLSGTSFTTEIKSEGEALETEFTDLEKRLQMAILAEPDPGEKTDNNGLDAEARERSKLRARVNLTGYIEAAAEKRSVDGAELEFNQAMKIGAHRFPLEILAPAPTEIEHRATTDVDIATKPRRWLDRLFSVSAASRVGVTFESVGAGQKSYPITKTGATGAQRGRTQAAAVAPWTIGVEELQPTRNGVHAVFSREDDLRNPGLEDALVRDLRMALMDAVDLAVFEGDSGANEDVADITGLQTASDVDEQTITQANKVKGSNVLAAFAALIDGKHATMGSDLRVVLSVGAQRLWMSTLANTGASVDTTIAEFLRRAGIEMSSRGGIDTDTGNGKFGAFIGRGRGLEGAGVAAVWSDGMLIVDPYSSAKTGEIQLSMNTFWNFGLPRPSNFARLKFVT